MDNCKNDLIQLFINEHKDEYVRFLSILKTLRCNLDSYYMYLSSLDVNSLYGIFNINYFYDYCRNNNKKVASTDASELDFISLNDDLSNILFKINSGEKLFLCHPNDLFRDKVLNNDIDYMLNIDWDNINIDNMFYCRNYSTINESVDGYKLLKERLSKLKSECSRENGTMNFYNVILSQYCFNDSYNYLVRAISREDFLGIDVAFNPKFYNKTLKKVI